jgi:Raf kinase inhibitor-like YbhB/YbcL family protein
MKLLALCVLFLTLTFVISGTAKAQSKMTISSSAFQPGGKIPDKFTCKGANINPSLQLSGVPASAGSLVLILDDPDAPGGLFTHWMIWNIPAGTTQISEKSAPTAATEGTNDFGKTGYGGPCPPSGTHRYFFRIIALDRKLEKAEPNAMNWTKRSPVIFSSVANSWPASLIRNSSQTIP